MSVNWQYFPQCDRITDELMDIVNVFNIHQNKIDSEYNNLKSNDVLNIITPCLLKLEYSVEEGKSESQLIKVPVLFGRNGGVSKSFYADAYNEKAGIVIEVEAGRAVTNYQFLKDIFQATVMHNVNYLVVAVRNKYRNQKDFDTVVTFLEIAYASQRLQLPLLGILIIGY